VARATPATIKRLFAVSGDMCAFPKCTQPLVHLGKVTGRICHIKAAKLGGPRHDVTQSEEERHGFANLLIMCPIHHDVIDADIVTYTVERLAAIKADHESRHLNGAEPTEEIAKQLINLESTLRALVPAEETLDGLFARVRKPAIQLLRNAETAWRFPTVTVAVRMRLKDKPQDSTESPRPVTLDILVTIARDANLIFCGEAGAGKTTALIELSNRLLDDKDSPLPIFLNAPTWAANSQPLLNYVASLPIFAEANVSLRDLARLHEAGKLLLVVNGWNEIGAARIEEARERLAQFVSGSVSPRILFSTRAITDTFGLPDGKRVDVHGLDWEQQRELIGLQLDAPSAQKLIARLASDHRLRGITRNPFFLTGVVALAKGGLNIPSSRFNLLEEVIQLYESQEGRKAALAGPPLKGFYRFYLEGLAEAMNASTVTLLGQSEARRAIVEVGESLATDKQLFDAPEPTDVIPELCNRHLLQLSEDGASLRFTHQRIQEFFAAAALIRKLPKLQVDASARIDCVAQIVNCPFWEDAIFLAAGRLANNPALPIYRALLVELALGVDLAFACRLAGILKLDKEDGVVWQTLSTRALALLDSGNRSAHEYALHALVATRSDKFAYILWPILESDDQQIRLGHYHLADGLRLEQLGAQALARIANWPDKRRAEFIWELAGIPENFEFIEKLAREDLGVFARAAAIGALNDWYSLSDVVTDTWLAASDAVKTEHSALHAALEVWRPDEVALTSELLRLARANPTGDLARSVGIALRENAEEIGIKAAKASLLEDREVPDVSGFVTLLKKRDPEFLRRTALERVFSGRHLAAWAEDEIRGLPTQERASLVDQAQEYISVSDHAWLDTAVIVEGATDSQVRDLLQQGLKFQVKWKGGQRLSDEESRRSRAIDQLLSHAPGNLLITAILEIAPHASYDEAAWLMATLERRTSSEPRSSKKADHWIPDAERLDVLIRLLKDKREEREVPGCELEAYLAELASRVEPNRYLPLMLEGIEKELQAWQTWEHAIQEWASKDGRKDRPNNPSLGQWFIRAFGRCGFEAVDGLLRFADQQSAEHTVIPALITVVTRPWRLLQKDRLWGGDGYLEQLRLCRQAGIVALQPDAALQEATDRVAGLLVRSLEPLAASPDAGPCEPWGRHGGPRQPWGLAVSLSRIPSQIGIPILVKLLGRTDVPGYAYADIAEGIVSQGELLSGECVREGLKGMWQRLVDKQWLDESSRYLVTRLGRLFLFLRPRDVALEMFNSVLPAWEKRAYHGEIIRAVDAVPTEEAVAALRSLLGRYGDNSEMREQVLYGFARNRTPEAIAAVVELIKDGSLAKFIDSRTHFLVERNLVPAIAQAIGSDPLACASLLDAIEAWDDTASEKLACLVLGAIGSPRASMIICRYLDSVRFPRGDYAVSQLLKLFSREEGSPGGNGWVEIDPQSRNDLRRHLFGLAVKDGPSRVRARNVLMQLELVRLSDERPSDEPRHPDIVTSRLWPSCLFE